LSIGGIAFGPKPKDFSFHLPKKIVALGFRSALSAKYQQDELMLVDHESLELDSHKTRQLAAILEDHYPNLKILVIDTELPSNRIILASRKLENITFMSIEDDINAYHLLNNKLLIVTTRASEYYHRLYFNH
jgi:large subunit ribosomal protein L4